jgi:hypothetical protein
MISVSFLTSMLAGLVTKLGIDQLMKHGYMPQATYIKAALKALEKDDLDEAIRSYHLSVRRWRPSQRTEVAGEIIASAIAVRIAKLERRMAELDEILYPRRFSRQFWLNLLPRNRSKLKALQEERKGYEEAITVLNKIRDNLNQRG